MTIYRLVYYSANRIDGADSELSQAVDEILAASRRNNAMVGITGALMFSSGYFGQVLEGSQAAIEATFERIQQDLRHGEVTLLEFAPVEARIFDSWAMAYVGEPSDLFAGLAGRTGFDESKILGEQLLARLRDRVASSLPA